MARARRSMGNSRLLGLPRLPDTSPAGGNVKLSWVPGKMGHEKEQVTLLWFPIPRGGH